MQPKLALCALLVCGALLAEDAPVVTVREGQLRGARTSWGVAFKGIPFAQPPIGDLRWREPQPIAPWSDVREATAFKPACAQLSQGWNAADVAFQSEDCLYLNVGTPALPPTKMKLPVFVWIHGGSNTAGSGEAPAFDRGALVERGMVWVTVNYRLGALGFFTHPELTAESAHRASGNYGLLDQIAALKWVQANIEKFGGDPTNVTVGGESAGAYDIGMLMTSPLAKGLFHRAIAESAAAPCFGGAATIAHATEKSAKIAQALNAPTEKQIAFLRTLSAEQILTAAKDAAGEDRTGLEASIDGYVLTEAPAEVFARGASLRIPLLIGTNAQEIGAPMPAERLRAEIVKTYGPLMEKRALAAYHLTPPDTGVSDAVHGAPGVQWSTDFVFRCPSALQTLWHAVSGMPTYEYEFERPQPGATASVHAAELSFLFDTWKPEQTLTDDHKKVSEQMRAYWANFVRTGDPNGAGLPKWPRFAAAGAPYLAFTNTGAEAKQGLRTAQCALYLEWWTREHPRALPKKK